MDAVRDDEYVPNDIGPTIVRVGVDVGQRQDYTAICVTEQAARQGVPHYLTRAIERLPLGTPYPDVVGRIEQIMERLTYRAWPGRGPRRFHVELILDATGVGLPVGDMLKERQLDPTLILFTGSDKVNEMADVTTVGKAWMVSRMQVLLQSRRLHLPRTPEASTLARELLDFRIDVSDRAHASYNARSGQHDDLVIALGLSCGIERTLGHAESRNYARLDRALQRDTEAARWRETRQRMKARL